MPSPSQRSHDVERCRNGNGEIWLDAISLTDLRYLQIVGDERREECLPHSIRQKTGEDSGPIRQQRRDKQQLARTLAYIGNCRGDESDDDERNQESEELTEQRVERNEHAHGHVG